MKFFIRTIFIIALFGFTSCTTTKNLEGSYRSNFADLGFFVTRIKLKSDSTFEYRFRGDLISDTATGKYNIEGRKLILTYDPRPIDTSGLAYMRSIGFKLDEPLNLKSDAALPHVFYLRGNKLFHSLQDGKIVRRATKFNKRKKYLFFGSHYYKRKWYLAKVE